MKALQFRNRQRDRRINVEALREVAVALLEQELELVKYELAVHLVSARSMADVNQRYLNHAGSTDVITFDYGEGYSEARNEQLELSGEIYISVPDAVTQAREFKTSWTEEIVRYLVHGTLHLRGYDDLDPSNRRLMKREENRLVRRLVRQFSIARISR